MAAYTGPITIYYNDEIGEELEGFVEKINDPAMECWLKGLCDDHVSRTSGRIDNFNEIEADLKNYVADLMLFRSKHEALYNGKTKNLMAHKNLYADLKIAEGEEILFVMNIATVNDTIAITAEHIKSNRLENPFDGKIIKREKDIFEIPLAPLESGFYFCK
jgi:hypothetical protein